VPVLHKYKNGNGYYALTSIRGQIVTFQITSEGHAYLQEAGVILDTPFNRFLLLDCYRMGCAFTGHSGFEISEGQGELDFSNDPQPCSVCNSPEDLHLVEIVENGHSVALLCGACRKKELPRIDTSVPVPLVTRPVLNRLLTMKDIHDIDKSVLAYRDLLNTEFSEKWKSLSEGKKRKKAQGRLLDDAPSDSLL
jgi:hypothetical protein